MLAKLGSVKLAAWLIGILLALCVVAFIVPQSTHADLTLYNEWRAQNPGLASSAHAAGLDDVFMSPIFLVATLLLAVNLTACTLNRLLRRRRRRLRVPDEPPKGSILIDLTTDVDGVARALGRELRLWKPSVATGEENTHLLHFDRGYWGFVGSMVLHAGLLLVMMGGLLSGLTRFDGRMVLTEGQTVADEVASYMTPPKVPVLGAAYSPFTIRLDSLRFDYEGSYILQSYARVTFSEAGRSAERESRVNVPARWDGKSFLMISGGHAVGIAVTGKGGEVLFPDGIVRLGNATPNGSEDTVELADGRKLRIATTASVDQPELAKAQRLQLRDPGVKLSLEGVAAPITARPGETVALGDIRVAVSDVTLWNEFAVRRDRGIPVTYLAFGVILVGTMMRFGFGKRALWCYVQEDGGTCRVSLWSSDDEALARAAGSLGADDDGKSVA